jgi:uncharacterized protein (DUF983 family)
MIARYHQGETNHCPGCGRSQWLVGRVSAECVFCSTALPLADSSGKPAPRVIGFGKGGGVVRRQMVAA